MFSGEVKGPIKVPEKPLSPSVTTEKAGTKREDLPDFDQLLGASNAIVQEQQMKDKMAQDGKQLHIGESKNDKEFREQLEKITGKSQDKLKQNLDKDDFITLMVTQLKCQDPTKPMDHQDMATQLAQFNSAEQLLGINKLLTEMNKTQTEAKGEKLAQYIGKEIQVEGNQIKLVGGKVTNSVKFQLPLSSQAVTVLIKDDKDQTIRTLPLGEKELGDHGFEWDGKNDKGELAASGKYKFSLNASSRDGKPINGIKTYFSTLVLGVTDIAKGGSLESDFGPIDLAKVTKIKNPEKTS